MAKKYQPLSVSFLGGVGEIGKNCTALRYGDEILIIDCGSTFPDYSTPGVDLIVPDFTFLKENAKNIKGLVLTHGHEDHIGGIPYLLSEIPNIPIYGSDLALALVKHKLEEKKVNNSKLNVVKDGDCINLGNFKVEFLKIAHSIIGAFALAITTPHGLVFHTGDFKIDYTPIGGETPVDISTFARIGNRGVKLMLGESTNVEKSGYTISEKHVGKTLEKIFSTNDDRRIIVATFASNVNRIQQIINIAEKFNRKVAFSGRSMINVCQMALDLGLMKTDSKNIVDIDYIKDYAPNDICIISTGSQGEPMSALTRMASGEDKVQIIKGDLVIISSSAIPGNEKAIYGVINNLYRRGAKVLYGSLEELHVSGHACREELKMMLSLIRPQLFIPVHGEYRHLKQHEKLAQDLGINEDNIMIADIGDTIEIKKNKLQMCKDKIKAGSVYLDGQGKITYDTLKERKRLSSDGIVAVVCHVDSSNKILKNNISIECRGIAMTESMLREVEITTMTTFGGLDMTNGLSISMFKEQLVKKITKSLNKYLQQKPVVMPIVIDIAQENE